MATYKNLRKVLNLPTLSASPSSGVNGEMYFNTGDSALYIYDGEWKKVTQTGVPNPTPIYVRTITHSSFALQYGHSIGGDKLYVAWSGYNSGKGAFSLYKVSDGSQLASNVSSPTPPSNAYRRYGGVSNDGTKQWTVDYNGVYFYSGNGTHTNTIGSSVLNSSRIGYMERSTSFGDSMCMLNKSYDAGITKFDLSGTPSYVRFMQSHNGATDTPSFGMGSAAFGLHMDATKVIHGDYQGKPANGWNFIGAAVIFDHTTGGSKVILAPQGSTSSTNDSSSSYFGFRTFIDSINNIAAVSKPYHGDGTYTKVGEIQLFNATTGAYISTIACPTELAATNAQFGYHMNGYGKYLVVGAPNYNSDASISGVGRGKIYVYDVTNPSSIAATANNPNSSSTEQFGSEISCSSEYIATQPSPSKSTACFTWSPT